MAASALVAIGTPTAFEGRRAYTAPTPPELGRQVWQAIALARGNGKTLAQFAAQVLRCTEWEEVVTGGICPFCGKRRPAPHSIGGWCYVQDTEPTIRTFAEYRRVRENAIIPRFLTFSERETLKKLLRQDLRQEWQIIQNRRKTGYPDPKARYHRHNDPDPAKYAVWSPKVDWGTVQWAYVLQVEPATLWVLRHVRVAVDETGWNQYVASVVGSYSLHAWMPEPDWAQIERQGYQVQDQLEGLFWRHPNHPLREHLPYLPAFMAI